MTIGLHNSFIWYLVFDFDRLYLEEHLGSTINFTPVDQASIVDNCSSVGMQEAEDSVSSSNSAYLTCAATSFDSTNLEEHLAKLTFIDVGEM